MQESVTLIPDVDEAGVEARHEFLHFCDVDVAHREVGRAGLVLVFNQSFVLKQGDGDLLRLDVNDNFTCHLLVF